MMRYVMIAILLIGFSGIAQQTKVGTIDVDFILSKMPELAQVQKGVEDYGNTLQVDLNKKMTDLNTELEKYKADEATLTIAQRKTRQDSLLAMEDDINKYRSNSSQLLVLKRDELMQPLFKKVGDQLEVIAKAQGYTQIFQRDNNLIYIDNNYDVTLDVIKALGIELEEGE
ncbi:OmpH family outer membrane protein [Aureitalea marina]|uniref:Outer membrane chaperone Skp n=1 Tax=Aureitalea marina TaxID=930804 RepID=A0A2S7KMT6_9FLAO|nr:OmpH family outer membrane protein [Aureitalea marina]PQB03944.1 hypothetical protein BST85_02745 [Aureitalea marina]